jgi:glycosyltransferase involved in cell wall biosynthesis
MRIYYFYQYFGTPQGSWSTRVYELTKRWVEEGHEVTVITSPYEKSDIKAKGFISRQQTEGIKLIVINAADSNRNSVPVRMVKAVLFSLVSMWFALVNRYDVLICSSGPITIGMPGLIGRWVRRKKFVFEVRDLWPAGAIEMGLIRNAILKKIGLFYEGLLYKSSNLVVTASLGQQKHIQLRYPYVNVEVVPNASDIQLFSSKSKDVTLPDWTIGKVLFTHIGSLGFIHNCIIWLQVAKELKKRGVNKISIVFIGDGAERSKLEEYKHDNELDNVYFLGLLPKHQLPLWVQSSRATLFATLNNPVQDASSPNKVFDSLAAGIPVIQTTKGWIKDIFDQYNCGLNVSLDEVEEIADKFVELAGNDQLFNELSKNANFVARELFDRDVLSRKYLQMLNQL